MVPTTSLKFSNVQNDLGDLDERAFEDSDGSEIEGGLEDDTYAVLLQDYINTSLTACCSLGYGEETSHEAPVRRLSTISPIKSTILSDNDLTLSIRLHQKDVWSDRTLRGCTGSENI